MHRHTDKYKEVLKKLYEFIAAPERKKNFQVTRLRMLLTATKQPWKGAYSKDIESGT